MSLASRAVLMLSASTPECLRCLSRLYANLDARTSTTAKVEALTRYFADAPAEDAAWATYFLAGGKPRQVVPIALLHEVALARAGIDEWLFEASYQAVGDLAETIALALPPLRLTVTTG